jgi:hypothetical protein
MFFSLILTLFALMGTSVSLAVDPESRTLEIMLPMRDGGKNTANAINISVFSFVLFVLIQ